MALSSRQIGCSLLEGMERDEKIAVVMCLIDSIPGINIVESETEPISSDDEAFLEKKLEEMTFSPRIEARKEAQGYTLGLLPKSTCSKLSYERSI